MKANIRRATVTISLGMVATLLGTLSLLSGCAGATADASGDDANAGSSAPQAVNDRIAIVADGSTQTIDLYDCSGFGFDYLGAPEAVVTSFEGGGSGIPVTSPGVDVAVNDGSGSLLAHLTITTNGELQITPQAGSSGAFTIGYSLSNDEGESSAEVDISIASDQEAPVPSDEPTVYFLFPRSQPIAGTMNLRANDDIGAPGALVGEFFEGRLGKGGAKNPSSGRLEDYQVGDVVDFAGGTLVVTPGGLFVFENWNEADKYSFVYTLENQYTDDHPSPGSYSAAVEIAVEGPPEARDDQVYPAFENHKGDITFNVVTGTGEQAGASQLELIPDVPGYSYAPVVSYGGLDFEALDGSVGDEVGLIDQTGGELNVSIDAKGLLSIDDQDDPPAAGDYRLEYTLENEFGASTATVTLSFP